LKLEGEKDAVQAGEIQEKKDQRKWDGFTHDENWTAAMPNQYLGQKKTAKYVKIKVDDSADEDSESDGDKSDDSEDSDSDIKNKIDQSESEDSGDEKVCKDKKLNAKIDKRIEKKLQKKLDLDVIGGGIEGNIDKAIPANVRDPDEDAFTIME